MRHCWFLLSVFALFISAIDARAQDKTADKAKPLRVKAEDRDHKPKSFDLGKDDDLKKFVEAWRKGELSHVEVEKELEPLKIWADLGLWAVVVFVALVFILRKFAWGPMLEGLHKREENILAAIEEAKQVRVDSQRAQAELQAKLDAAFAEIPKMMEEARRDAEALKEEMRAAAAKDIQTERQRLRREIDTARDQALQDIWNQAAQLATAISSKVLVRALTPEDHNRLLHLALEELQGQKEFLKN